MMLTDHISTFVPNPLIGPNIEELGTRFPVRRRFVCRLLYLVMSQGRRGNTRCQIADTGYAANTRKYSYAPFSGYMVGAALLCEDGSIIFPVRKIPAKALLKSFPYNPLCFYK